MAYCVYCSSPARDGAKFCGKCGRAIEQKAFMGKTTPLYERLIRGHNILIAGCTGSGKSTLINALLEVISLENVNEHRTVLIDVKQVELGRYVGTKHCLACATSIEEAERTLTSVLNIIQERLTDMRERKLTHYDKYTLHLVIDEMADLILTSKKATNLIQRIAQLGRAAKVQVIMATQCPLASVIPTRIKVNFPVTIGLHTVTSQHSRNIIEENGCEELPMHGEALIRFPGEPIAKHKLPMFSEELIWQAIEADRR